MKPNGPCRHFVLVIFALTGPLLLHAHVLVPEMMSVEEENKAENMIRRMPRPDPETAEEKFTRIDKDGDQSLSFDEFILRDKWNVDWQSGIFDRADLNNDKRLSFIEFYKQNKWFTDNNQRQYKMWDTNGDGKVSKAEFDAYYAKLEEQRKQWSKKVMDRFDLGDSKLSKEEVRRYLTEYHMLKTQPASASEARDAIAHSNNDRLLRGVNELLADNAHVRDYMKEFREMARTDATGFDTVFAEYDLDSDGFWNLDEFHKFHLDVPYHKFKRIPKKNLEN